VNIAVVGTGYVGLVSGVCLADTGNNVMCVDIDADKVAALKQGKLPIYEPGLQDVFDRNYYHKRIQFTTSLAEGVREADMVFLALPTPPGADGEADLSFILQVADDLGPLMDHYMVVVDKSTVPVGTADKVRARIAAKAQSPFDVVSNPEFLREGYAVQDFMKPDRIVIGTDSALAKNMLSVLYRPYTAREDQLIWMDTRSAEMTKYAANSFLAMKVSFINEIANLCEAVGANVEHVRVGIGSDERIGQLFLQPGIGYGGSCFPKDVQALHKTAKDNNYDFKILQAILEANARQKRRLVEKLLTHFDDDLTGKHFAVWGLAFKPNTDDIREAPALEIIKELTDRGATVAAYDPEARDNTERHFAGNQAVRFHADMHEALQDAHALLILTEWDEFKEPDLARVKALLKTPLIFDGRNMHDHQTMHDAGFQYFSIGRLTVDVSAKVIPGDTQA
jgi:UDPglucose 6-dehydrogenase